MKINPLTLKIKYEDLYLYFEKIKSYNFVYDMPKNGICLINNLNEEELKIIKPDIPEAFYMILSLNFLKLSSTVLNVYCNDLYWAVIFEENPNTKKFWNKIKCCFKSLSKQNRYLIKDIINISDFPSWFLQYLNKDEIKEIDKKN